MDIEKAISGVLKKPELSESSEMLTNTEILDIVQRYANEHYNTNQLGRALKKMNLVRINNLRPDGNKKVYRVHLLRVNGTEKPKMLASEALKKTFRAAKRGEAQRYYSLSTISALITKKFNLHFDRNELRIALRGAKIPNHTEVKKDPTDEKKIKRTVIYHVFPA